MRDLQDRIVAFLKSDTRAFTTAALIDLFTTSDRNAMRALSDGEAPASASQVRRALRTLVDSGAVEQSIRLVKKNGGGNYANTYRAK